MQGDKVVKRILGHADQDVTSLYNQYGYVKEVRACLTRMAERLLVGRKMRYVLPDSQVLVPGGGVKDIPLAA
jgi:hypothetical protein